MTKPLSRNQGPTFQPHALQIVLFGPFTYEPTIMCGSLWIVSLHKLFTLAFPINDWEKKNLKKILKKGFFTNSKFHIGGDLNI